MIRSAPLSRRVFLLSSGSCAAHLALVGMAVPASMRSWWPLPPRREHAREPFGSLERVADGVWALISTPLTGDRTTLSNGGIIAGRDAVLAVEGFFQARGAEWLAGHARALTGRWPTHVVLTHYHADHANGVAGYMGDGRSPAVRATGTTRDQVLDRNRPADEARSAALAGAVLLPAREVTTLDLGGRVVQIVPRAGHTDSDVSVELDEPSIVFCGDLFWNHMFPNYVDATPGRLRDAVRALRRARDTVYIPGHGAVGGAADFDRHAAVLDVVEEAARRAYEAGSPAAEAAEQFSIPPSLGDWILFNRVFFERAFSAWYREWTP